jgi:hypothetical protein
MGWMRITTKYCVLTMAHIVFDPSVGDGRITPMKPVRLLWKCSFQGLSFQGILHSGVFSDPGLLTWNKFLSLKNDPTHIDHIRWYAQKSGCWGTRWSLATIGQGPQGHWNILNERECLAWWMLGEWTSRKLWIVRNTASNKVKYP